MFHDILLEQQHAGRIVGIVLVVITAALRRQQQNCIACFVTPRMAALTRGSRLKSSLKKLGLAHQSCDASLSSREVGRGGNSACLVPPMLTGKMYSKRLSKVPNHPKCLSVRFKHRPSYEAIKHSVLNS